MEIEIQTSLHELCLCTGVRAEGSRHRQSTAGAKKGGHRFTKKHTTSDMKKSRSSPCHLTASTDEDRDPDSYQTISVQVSVDTVLLLEIRVSFLHKYLAVPCYF